MKKGDVVKMFLKQRLMMLALYLFLAIILGVAFYPDYYSTLLWAIPLLGFVLALALQIMINKQKKAHSRE